MDRGRAGSLCRLLLYRGRASPAQFLEEHWQKLILCLAVLLIVVSSTVGAGLVLGPLLWSPLGKCTLALIATSLFAAFGVGLVRWGADRAGRMMLIATLIVVPIHFMLAGELKLLLEPSPSRLIVLAIDALALLGAGAWCERHAGASGRCTILDGDALALEHRQRGDVERHNGRLGLAVRRVSSAGVGLPGCGLGSRCSSAGARPTTSTANSPTWSWVCSDSHWWPAWCVPGSTPFGWSRRFMPSRSWSSPSRSIHAARRLVPYEPDAQHLAWLRFGGYVLSGLAFALALARPPVSSSLFSGNLIAVAVLGLGLYATSLRNLRHPAFLYLSAGALVVAGLGIRFFVAGRLHFIEEVVRTALHYPDHLPWPFRAIPALVASTALGLAVDLDYQKLERPQTGEALPLSGCTVIDRGVSGQRHSSRWRL